MKKLTYEFVRSEFEKRRWHLLSTEYTGNTEKLKYICDKGHTNYISWNVFKSNCGCSICSKGVVIKKLQTPFNIIKSKFKELNYTLLSTKYINNRTKLEYICDKGHHNYTTWSKICIGRKCPKCFGGIKYNIDFIKSEFEKYGYHLLSTEYINAKQKLEFICNNNHSGFISWNHFKRGNRCSLCSSIKLTFEFVKSKFEEIGYTLVSTEYKNSITKLDYICDKGHKGKINWVNLSSGNRCKQCYLINNSGENSCLWKGGVSELNLPLFDTFSHQLDWIEEVRHDPENTDLLQVRCTNCNEWFTPTRVGVCSRLNGLRDINVGENRFYCSDECKNSCSIFKQRIYPKGFKVDRSREVQPELAAMVFERDSHECQRCGNKIDLECHHYEGIEQNPIESADIDMCVTLCKQCHKLAHKDKGCRFIDLRKENLCK